MSQYDFIFHSAPLGDDRAGRVVALRLLERLGIERVASPPQSPDGEVWACHEPRQDAEIDRWV